MTTTFEHLRSISLQELSKDPSATEWLPALRAQDFRQALTCIESQLHATGDHTIARIWWVLLQLEEGSLPVMALSTPLDEAFDGLSEHPAGRASAAEAFARVAQLLSDRGQLRLARIMAERANTVAAAVTAYGAAERNAVRNVYRSVIASQIAQAKERLGDAETISSLEALLTDLSLETEDEAEPVPRDEKLPEPGQDASARSTVFNSKSILEDTFSSTASDGMRAESPDEMTIATPYPRRRLLLSGGALFLALGLAFGARTFYDTGTGGMLELAMAVPLHHDAELVVPKTELMFITESDSSQLELVQDRLAQLGKRAPSGESASSANSKSIDDMLSDPQIDTDAMAAVPSPVDVVALPPQETSDVKSEATIPTLPATSVPQARVEDLGRTRGARRVARGPDGRLYGPGPNGTDMQGQPVRAYAVEQYEKPMLYRTITATTVLEAPSVLAPSIERLTPDAKIQVVSKMGQWLELRSGNGKRGFIYAQDAELVQ